jgi:putative transposase
MMSANEPLQRHTYHRIFLHLTWHCHGDRPLITPEMEPRLHDTLRDLCHAQEGVFFRAVGGTETHVHVAIQTAPSVTPSEVARRLKGGSAREINKRFGSGSLEWQRGYGVVAFSESQMPAIARYIANQKEHHRTGTIRDGLEQWGQEWERVRQSRSAGDRDGGRA